METLKTMIDEYAVELLELYKTQGEDLVIWNNGVLKKSLKHFSDSELLGNIGDANNGLNDNYIYIIKDTINKRRFNKIKKIKNNIK